MNFRLSTPGISNRLSIGPQISENWPRTIRATVPQVMSEKFQSVLSSGLSYATDGTVACTGPFMNIPIQL